MCLSDFIVFFLCFTCCFVSSERVCTKDVATHNALCDNLTAFLSFKQLLFYLLLFQQWELLCNAIQVILNVASFERVVRKDVRVPPFTSLPACARLPLPLLPPVAEMWHPVQISSSFVCEPVPPLIDLCFNFFFLCVLFCLCSRLSSLPFLVYNTLKHFLI